MPASRTEIANLALGHFGQYRIDDIDERTPTAEAVRDCWHICRDSILRAHHWNFATAAAILTQLAAPPLFGWAFQWQLPADFLKLVSCNGVYSGTRDTEFSVRGTVLLTNEQQAQIEYVRSVPECELWDSNFVEAFALKLAEMVAPRLSLSGSQAESLARRTQAAGQLAAHSDAIDSRPHVRRAEEGSAYQAARYGDSFVAGGGFSGGGGGGVGAKGEKGDKGDPGESATADATIIARITALELIPPGSSAVTSVAGRTGAVTLTWSDIGGAALPLALTSAPGLLSAAGGTFGSAAFLNASSFVPTARAVNGQSLTGDVTITDITGSAGSFTGALAGDVTGLQGATAIAASTVTGKALTGYASGSGTVSATDSILSAINKLNGNDALKAPIASPIFTGTVSLGNINWQDNTVWNFTPGTNAKANIQSALTLGAFDDATHKGIILTGVLTITSNVSTPVFTYASGADAIHRTALGLGTLATVSPTGTADATAYLRGDGAWATNLAVTTETTTARTLSLADNNNYIRCTNASPTTITIPLQATVTWPPAAMITFRRATGAGAVTLAGVSGVTVAGNTASSIAAEGVFAIVRTGENTWDFV